MTSLFATAARAGYVTFFGEEFCYTGSPYVVQDHFFPVAPDVSLLPLFCRLAEDTQRRQGNASAPLWSVEWGPCVHGRPRAALALEHLRGLWDARTAAMPAFAFLNARAAHDYAADEARRYARAEAYDALLAAFLRGLLADHGRDTVVVVRSDHGRQGGPARREHAAQAEHVLVVPGRVPTTVVRRNADAALVTGFDLHRTLVGVVTGAGGGGTPWSVDLLRAEVPQNRTCAEAGVPQRYCRCSNERTDSVPYNAVGEEQIDLGDGSTCRSSDVRIQCG
mmetsp:Transcript_29144/g.57921  ORF Transcript_29144/g.57921 Transcript_29144/m.57921 type:complete len:279 (-) Transcript_29144:1255-2091(-)